MIYRSQVQRLVYAGLRIRNHVFILFQVDCRYRTTGQRVKKTKWPQSDVFFFKLSIKESQLIQTIVCRLGKVKRSWNDLILQDPKSSSVVMLVSENETMFCDTCHALLCIILSRTSLDSWLRQYNSRNGGEIRLLWWLIFHSLDWLEFFNLIIF